MSMVDCLACIKVFQDNIDYSSYKHMMWFGSRLEMAIQYVLGEKKNWHQIIL